MALWVPSGDKFYIPQQPVTRILNTDEYVTRTSQYYHASSSRLLCVGHPYWAITDRTGKVTVPKVSGLQYRVFQILLPDPNKFVFPDPNFFNPDNQRLVWGLVGIEIDRGQPMGVGLSGNPFMNKLDDVENPGKAGQKPGETKDNRVNLAFDPKQQQLLVVGCRPCYGEHWGQAKACRENEDDKCPPIELKLSEIQDGDMMDVGLGAMDFRTLQANKSNAPLEIAGTTCKYPDFIRMAQEVYGDRMFFCVKSEQMYVRHFLTRDGALQETAPDSLILNNNSKPPLNTNYWASPSGSLVTSNNTIFNKPYWIRRAQGHNNGMLWNNQLFITLGDTTRGTNLNISVSKNGIQDTYTADKFYEFVRHVEEFEVEIIVQVCIVNLTPDTVAHIHQMDPDILENWNLGVHLGGTSNILETYRYIGSAATKCPDQVPPKEPKNPYEGLTFWKLDFTDKLTQDLDYSPLGRKFLFQTRGGGSLPRKRKLTSPSDNAKRRRKNVNKK